MRTKLPMAEQLEIEVPEDFIRELYCELGFMPLPSQINHLYRMQLRINDFYNQNNHYDFYYELNMKKKYLYSLYKYHHYFI